MSTERQPGWFTLEEVIGLAKETILRDGHHVPTIIADGEAAPAIHQLIPFPETHEGRVRRMLAAGLAMGQSGRLGALMQVFLVSEGWVSVADKDRPPQVPPS